MPFFGNATKILHYKEINVSKEHGNLFISTYSLKPRFQHSLRHIRDWIVKNKFSPNQITLFTCLLCIVYSIFIVWPITSKLFLIFLPIFLLVRMALNALDGMVATHTNNTTKLGVILNEVCDVISDLALFAAFLSVLNNDIPLWLVLMFASIMIEFVSLAVFQANGIRPLSGPFGKSDRAVYLGLLALLIVFQSGNNTLFQIYIIIGLVLALITIWNRTKFQSST